MSLFSLSGEDAAEASAEISVGHRLTGEIDDGVGAAEFVECGVRHHQLDEDFGGADREIEFDEAIVAPAPDADELGMEQFARFASGSPHILLLSRSRRFDRSPTLFVEQSSCQARKRRFAPLSGVLFRGAHVKIVE
jgi:hypothetical protein